jgi:hypothetical protein
MIKHIVKMLDRPNVVVYKTYIYKCDPLRISLEPHSATSLDDIISTQQRPSPIPHPPADVRRRIPTTAPSPLVAAPSLPRCLASHCRSLAFPSSRPVSIRAPLGARDPSGSPAFSPDNRPAWKWRHRSKLLVVWKPTTRDGPTLSTPFPRGGLSPPPDS